MQKNKKKISRTASLALGFFVIILIGSILLSLPIATRSGEVSFSDAIFTATSATCVTGLVVQDTYQHWSVFGQLVILTMIQIGGLGFLTIGVYVSILLRRRIGLSEREALHESVNTIEVAGVVRLVRRIIQGTFILEFTGAALLSIRFIPQYGLIKGIYYSIFHAISAFCNAGFDLLGAKNPYCSFTEYYGDPLVTITLMCLIIVGGIGFIVWEDIYRKKWHFRKYLLHSKIVLTTTIVLIFGGALLFFLLECNNTLQGMNAKEQILSSLFSSITARTAGFNTVDTNSISNGSKVLTMILMFIGGSSGSTAGGIKTTTLVVMLVSAFAMISKKSGVELFGRRLPEEAIKKANAIVIANLSLILISAIVIFANQALPFEAVFFETFSAIGTVGMSTGVTRELSEVSRVVIMLLMYSGRVGSLSFALIYAGRKSAPPVQNTVEKIVVG